MRENDENVTTPNDPSSPTAGPDATATPKGTSGSSVQRMVRLLDTAFRQETVIKNTKLADSYVKHGWQLKDVKTEYWSTDLRGGFDGCFVYHLKNKSWFFRFVGERINRYVLKRASAVWRWASSPNIKQHPSLTKQSLDRYGRRNVGLQLLKTSEVDGVHGVCCGMSQPNVV